MPSSDRARLLRRSLWLVLPWALALGWLEWRLRAMPNSYSAKHAALSAAAGQVDTLILGPSEAAQGIDPAVLGPGAFNLAQVGQDPVMDKALLLAWAPRLPGLKRVIWAVCYPSLRGSLLSGQEAWRRHYYALFMGVDPYPGAGRDLRSHSAFWVYEPWASLKLAWGGFKGQAAEMDAQGFQANPAPDAEDAELRINGMTAGRKVALHEAAMRPENEPANLAALRQGAAWAHDKGIKLAWVTPPVSRPYAAACDREARLAWQASMLRLARESGSPWLNDSDAPGYEEKDFFDPDHLHQGSARAYTRSLKARLPRL